LLFSPTKKIFKVVLDHFVLDAMIIAGGILQVMLGLLLMTMGPQTGYGANMASMVAADIEPGPVEWAVGIEQGLGNGRMLFDRTIVWSQNDQVLGPHPSRWMRIKFHANEAATQQSWQLAFLHGLPLQATVYLLDHRGQELQSARLGSLVPIENWQDGSFQFGHKFNLDRPGDYYFLIEMRTIIKQPFSVKFLNPEQQRLVELRYVKTTSIGFGGLAAMVTLSFMLWKSLGKRIFRRYAMLNVNLFLLNFYVSGGFAWITSHYWPHLSFLSPALVFTTLAYSLVFMLDYLRLSKSRLLVPRLITNAVYFMGVTIILSLFQPILAQHLFDVSFGLGCLLLMGQMIAMAMKKKRFALLPLIGFLPMFAVFLAMNNIGIDFATEISFPVLMPIASMCLSLTLGVGLALRLTEFRQQMLDFVTRKNQELEVLVGHRTKELNENNRRLADEVEHRKIAQTDAVEQAKQLRDAQLKMLAAAKMTALGEMATGVSHEINNPLTILRGNLYLIESSLGKEPIDIEKVKRVVDKCQANVERMAVVIKTLREFAMTDESSDQMDCYVDDVVSTTCDLARETLARFGVQLRIDTGAERTLVTGGKAELGQVLMGCISNSCDAIKNLEERWIHISIVTDELYVAIRIADSGRGVLEDDVPKLFTPFFSTKRSAKTAGLSLSMGRQMLLRHGGDLRYVSDASHTTFEIMLRRAFKESHDCHLDAAS
jgi:signal transduction histidine kinase